jgi:hypothetical protein
MSTQNYRDRAAPLVRHPWVPCISCKRVIVLSLISQEGKCYHCKTPITLGNVIAEKESHYDHGGTPEPTLVYVTEAERAELFKARAEIASLRTEVERLEKLRVEAVSAVTGEAKILLENAALRARVKEMEAAHETDLGRIVGLEGDLADTRARVAELEAERDAADALSKLLTEQVNINAEDRDKAHAEAAELKRLAGEVVKALENSSLYYGDAPYLCDEIKDLARHLSTTTETPTQAAITAEGEQ